MVKGREWLRLRRGAKWPKGNEGRDLLRRLNRVGRDIGHPIYIYSGQRTWLEQHRAYMDYLNGGVLAAACCPKHYRHKPSDCLRQPTSMHCQGRAADCGVLWTNGSTTNIGQVVEARASMRRHGLCLPVGSGEVWHVQVGDTWLS